MKSDKLVETGNYDERSSIPVDLIKDIIEQMEDLCSIN